MPANLYRGEVEFTVPGQPGVTEDRTYLMRFGVNGFIAIQETLAPLKGVAHLRCLLHAALTSIDAQKTMTLEDAGDILDDIGIDEGNALVAKTKWGIHTDKAIARAEKALAELQKKADDEKKALEAGIPVPPVVVGPADPLAIGPANSSS